MTSSEDELVHSTLLEIETIIRDLHWTVANGYYMGYELGYMKGVLEHLLSKHPNVTTRGDYLKGYLNGYGQGLLYLVRSKALGRPVEQHEYGMTPPEVTRDTAERTVVSRDGFGQERGSIEDMACNEDFQFRETTRSILKKKK